MIDVLIADDSPTARALLSGIVVKERGMRVVGEARNGAEAVEMTARLSPTVITMDIQMPEMDGFRATQEIMTRFPKPIIIVSSSARADDVALSLEATRAGALMVLPKPDGAATPNGEYERQYLVKMLKAMSEVKVVRRHAAGNTGTSQPPRPLMRPARSLTPRVIAIAASTGGPVALQTILSALPRSLKVPVLIVQHIAHGFTPGLAKWLAADSSLPIKVAGYAQPAEPGTVYIAPDHQHLGLKLGYDGTLRLLLDASPPIGAFRPSATYLFKSVAEALGGSMIGVILTGMGDDGVAGLGDAHAAGAFIIAQDESTSTIYGMPREAALAGVVDCVLPITEIAPQLVELVG